MTTDSTLRAEGGDVKGETALSAYQSGPKWISSGEALKAVYNGVHKNTKLTARQDKIKDNDYFVWYGPNGDKVGTFFCPNPYNTAPLKLFYSSSITKRVGLKIEHIGLRTVNFIEKDDVSLDEQCRVIDAFEKQTGIQFSLLTLSGDVREGSLELANQKLGKSYTQVQKGKSVHAFLSLSCSTTLEYWTLIQKHLIVLLRSDCAVMNVNHTMRLAGALGTSNVDPAVRVQMGLRALKVSYDPRWLLDELAKQVMGLGLNLEIAFKALELSAHAKGLIKKGGLSPTELEDLEDIATRCYDTRTHNRFDSRIISQYIAKSGNGKVVTGPNGETLIEIPGDTRIHFADGGSILLSQAHTLPGKVICYDPIFENPGSSAASAALWPSGILHSKSHGAAATYRAAKVVETTLPQEWEPLETFSVSVPVVQKPTPSAKKAAKPPGFPSMEGILAAERAFLAVCTAGTEHCIPERRNAQDGNVAPVNRKVLATALQVQDMIQRSSSSIEKKLRGMGMVGLDTCSWPQVVENRKTGMPVQIGRDCGKSSCLQCSVKIVGAKIAGILGSVGISRAVEQAELNKLELEASKTQDKLDQVMDARPHPLYVYRLDGSPDGFIDTYRKWVKKFQPLIRIAYPISISKDEPAAETQETLEDKHFWVSAELDGNQSIVLSDVRLPDTRRRKWNPTPVTSKKVIRDLVGEMVFGSLSLSKPAKATEAEVQEQLDLLEGNLTLSLTRVDAAYQAVQIPNVVSVETSLRSSKSVCLDPDLIVKAHKQKTSDWSAKNYEGKDRPDDEECYLRLSYWNYKTRETPELNLTITFGTEKGVHNMLVKGKYLQPVLRKVIPILFFGGASAEYVPPAEPAVNPDELVDLI